MDKEPIFRGTTFDDFLLRPQYGVLGTRKDADLTMPLTKNLQISLPVIAANMDTVTGADMMKTTSLEGSFAFLHRNCPIETQAQMAREVKRQHSYVIENPSVIHADATIAQAVEMARQRKISSLLVEKTPGSGILAGILSRRNIERALAVNDINNDTVSIFMTPMPLTVASPGVPMSIAKKIMLDSGVEKLPLVEGSDDVWYIKGLITKKDIRTAEQMPNSSKNPRGQLLVGAAIGATGDFLERAAALIEAGTDCIVIDIAHAHSAVMERAINQFRARFGNSADLVCGNIATGEAAKFLLALGVDAVKVGIGPGRGCRTRLETGFGVPQLQAIREVYLALEDKVPVIADAGMKTDKDFFLAIVCGASTCMAGSMFAGTDESPGEFIINPATNQKFKLYRGMTSPQAVIAGASDEEIEEKLSTPAEGQTVEIPYNGSVKQILHRIKGHMQSAVSYAGEETLKEARQKIAQDPAKYLIRLSEASKRESFER